MHARVFLCSHAHRTARNKPGRVRAVADGIVLVAVVVVGDNLPVLVSNFGLSVLLAPAPKIFALFKDVLKRKSEQSLQREILTLELLFTASRTELKVTTN